MNDSAPILILNYNGWRDTFELVSLLLERSQNVWVIDNGSPVDRSEELLRRFPAVNYLPLGHNWGWAGGYNRAIDHVRQFGFEHVYILNNDAVPEPGAIESALAHLSSRPGAAAVGSVILDDGGQRAFFDGKFNYPSKSLDEVDPGLVRVERIHGGGFALSIAAFDRVGPFHEPYFLYHEESEWCLRAGALGLELYVDGASRLVHEGQGSDTNNNSVYYLVRNRYLALARGFPLDEASRSKIWLMSVDLLAAAERTGEQRKATVEGMLDGLAGRFGRRNERRPSLSTTTICTTLPVSVLPIRALRKLKRVLART